MSKLLNKILAKGGGAMPKPDLSSSQTNSESAKQSKPPINPNSKTNKVLDYLHKNVGEPANDLLTSILGINDIKAGVKNKDPMRVAQGAMALPFLALTGAENPELAVEKDATNAVTIGRKTANEIIADKKAGMPYKVNSASTGEPTKSAILDAKGNPIVKTQEPLFAPDNQLTTSLNSKTERFPQNQSVQTQSGTKPYPDVPDQPRLIMDRVGKHPVTGGNSVWLDFSDQAKKNNYYLEDQQKAQNVLDKYVAGDTPLEVQQNLPLQLQEESQRIKNTIAQNPQNINRQELADANAINMQKAGITPGNNVKADAATTNLLKELDSQLNAGKININSTKNINGGKLQDYIKLLDNRLQSTYKKIDNGTTLTPEENATLTMRRTASEKLKSLYPNAAAALDRQSAMMDARPYVAKAASKEMEAQTSAARTIANMPQQNMLNKILSPIGRHPLLSIGALTTAGGIGATGAYIANLENSKPKSYQFSSGNVSLPSLSKITDSTGNSLTVNVSDYVNKTKAINDQEKAIALNVQLGIPSAVAQQSQLESERNSLDTQYQTTKPIYDQYVETSNQIQGLNEASQLLKKANPQWFQAFGPLGSKFTAIKAALVPGYAQFEQQLNNLHQQFGIDPSVILSAASPDAADAAINQIVKSYKTKLENTIQNNGGVLPSENTKSATGKEVIQQQINNIVNTGSKKLDEVLTPTSAPEQPSPTPNNFQQLLQAKFQPGQI